MSNDSTRDAPQRPHDDDTRDHGSAPEPTGEDQTARERTLGITPEQEQAYLADQRTQPQPADGGIGAMTDMQGREPDTRN